MINPAGILWIEGDMDALAAHAAAITRVGAQVADTGARIHAGWQGLAAVYHAPEADQLFAATGPVQTISASTGEDITAVGAALSTYATEVAQLKARLETLRADAVAFVAQASTYPDWAMIPAYVERNNELIAAVNAATAEFMDAQRRCANAILARYSNERITADNGDATATPDEYGYTSRQLDAAAAQSGALPWGTTTEVDPGIPGRVFGGALQVVSDKFTGLLTLGGYQNGTFSLNTAGTAWAGFATFAATAVVPSLAGLNDTRDLPGLPRGTLRNQQVAAVKDLFAYDTWATDPARAFGMTTTNIIVSVLGLRGIGTAARATGLIRTANLIDRVPTITDVVGALRRRLPGLHLPRVTTPHIQTPHIQAPDVHTPHPPSTDTPTVHTDTPHTTGSAADPPNHPHSGTSGGAAVTHEPRNAHDHGAASHHQPVPASHHTAHAVGAEPKSPHRNSPADHSATSTDNGDHGRSPQSSHSGKPGARPTSVDATPSHHAETHTGHDTGHPVTHRPGADGADPARPAADHRPAPQRGGDHPLGHATTQHTGPPANSGHAAPAGHPGHSDHPPGQPHTTAPTDHTGSTDHGHAAPAEHAHAHDTTTAEGPIPADHPLAHSVDGRPLPPPTPGEQSLGYLHESRLGRGPDGLIHTVDGKPVDQYLHEFGQHRAEQFRHARENGDFGRKDVGEVTSVAIDRRTGEIVEATNGRKTQIPADRLHPLLADRVADLRSESGYPAVNRDGTMDPTPRHFPHPDEPLRHEEVKAVNELLNHRGADAGSVTFEEIRVDNFFPFHQSGVESAPCCANCAALLDGTPSNAGRFTGIPAQP